MGVVQFDFVHEGISYNFVDAGGQRAERRKWIHHFDDVTALVYVTALTDYAESLFEDDSTNRLVESLSVFADLMSHHNWPVILLFNKLDLFQKMYAEQRVPLDVSGLFPDAPSCPSPEDTEEPPSVWEAIDWMSGKFRGLMWEGGKAQMYVHAASAVDVDSVMSLFNDIKTIILKEALSQMSE